MAKKLWKSQSRPRCAATIKDILGRYLLTPNDTRWNSLADAMALLKKIKPKLNTLMEALGERKFTPEELIFLDEYVLVTKPIAISLDKLQSNSASLGLVLPTIVKLVVYYEEIIAQKSLKVCEPLAMYILQDLKDRTAEYYLDKDYILGKFKDFLYLLFKSRYKY